MGKIVITDDEGVIVTKDLDLTQDVLNSDIAYQIDENGVITITTDIIFNSPCTSFNSNNNSVGYCSDFWESSPTILTTEDVEYNNNFAINVGFRNVEDTTVEDIVTPNVGVVNLDAGSDLKIRVRETNVPIISEVALNSIAESTPELRYTILNASTRIEYNQPYIKVIAKDAASTATQYIGKRHISGIKYIDCVLFQNGVEVKSYPRATFSPEQTYNADSVEYIFNDSENIIPDGDYIFKIIIEDNDGNIKEQTYEVTVDATNPSITVTTQPPQYIRKEIDWEMEFYVNNDAKIKVTLVDEENNETELQKDVHYTISGDLQNEDEYLSSQTYIIKLTEATNLNRGRYWLRFYTKDTELNQHWSTEPMNTQQFIFDDTEPVIKFVKGRAKSDTTYEITVKVVLNSPLD